MKETARQYAKRILSNTVGRDPLRVLEATPRTLAQIIRGVPKKALVRRPRPGKWSVAEILAHLAETEIVNAYRLRMILSRNRTPIQAFDQNAFARVSDYRRMDPDRSLELFSVVRATNLALLGSLEPRQWSFYGIHEERGKETVRRMVRLEAGHDVNHLAQVERILARRRQDRRRTAERPATPDRATPPREP